MHTYTYLQTDGEGVCLLFKQKFATRQREEGPGRGGWGGETEGVGRVGVGRQIDIRRDKTVFKDY